MMLELRDVGVVNVLILVKVIMSDYRDIERIVDDKMDGIKDDIHYAIFDKLNALADSIEQEFSGSADMLILAKLIREINNER
jgi:hypothetical protein